LHGEAQLYIRAFSLIADVLAASVFIANTGPLAVFIFPVSITIIIGYGFRFGLLYSLAALTATILGLIFAVRANGFLQDQHFLSAALYLSVIYAPIYSYYLLGKYRTLLGQRNQLLEERKLLIETIAHEFRSPLHALIFLIECARELNNHRSKVDQTQQIARLSDILEKASLSSERMVTLADRLLATHIDQPRSGAEPTNLVSTLRDVIELCRIHARRRALRLYWNLSQDIPPFVHLDRQIFQDIIVNVLDNAIKHTSGTSVVCEVSTMGRYELRVHIYDVGAQTKPRTIGRDQNDDSEFMRPQGGAGRPIIKRQLKKLGGSIEETKTGINWHTVLMIPMRIAHLEKNATLSFSIALHIGESALDQSTIEYLMTEGVFCRYLPPGIGLAAEDVAASIDLVLVDDAIESAQIGVLSSVSNETHFPVVARVISTQPASAPLGFPINAAVHRDSRGDWMRIAALVRKSCTPGELQGNRMLDGLVGLVVDDSEIARSAIRDYLGKQGASIAVAGAVLDGKHQANSIRHFDFALIDMQLGNEDGIVLVKHLRMSYGPDLAVVVLTGYSDPEVEDAAKNAGADDVLLKSCSGNRLVTTLLAAMKARRKLRIATSLESEAPASSDRVADDLSSHQRKKVHSEFMQKLASCVYCADKGSNKDALRYLHQLDGIAQICAMPSDIIQLIQIVRVSIVDGKRVADRTIRDMNKAIVGFLFQSP